MVGANIFDYIAPSFHNTVRKAIEKTFRTGQPGFYECQGTTPNGETYWYETHIGPIKSDHETTAVILFAVNTTERKLVEKYLRDQDELLKNIITNIPAYVSWKDRDAVYLGSNETFAKAAGFSGPKELVGKTDYDMAWEKEKADFYRKCDKEVIESNQPMLNVEETQHRADGSKIVLLTNRVPLRDINGQAIGVLGINYDMTERKRAEEALKESEVKYRTLFESAAEGIILANIKTKKFHFANPAICNLLGYTQEELLEMSVENIHPKESLGEVSAAFEEQVRQGGGLALGLPCKRKDGSVIYVNINAAMMRIGDIDFMVGFFMDITESRKIQEALQESEAQFRALFETSSDAIMLLDEKAFFDCNEATLKLFGVPTKKEFTTFHPAELSPPYQPNGVDSMTMANQRIKEAYTTGKNQFEWMHRRTNGEDFPAEVWLSVLTLKGKKVLQATVRDISERKHREALEAKSEFLSMVSHELKTPLHCIAEGINIVLDGAAGKINREQKEMLSTSKKSVDRLSRLITSALSYQRLEADSIALEEGHYNVNELITGIGTLLDAFVRARRIKFKLNLTKPLPRVWCDRDKIIQVLWNLIDNAFKHTHKGTVTISTALDKRKNMVKVSVKDTGVGIEKSRLDKLFNGLKNHRNNHPTGAAGSGLGLIISKRIIEHHGGTITVESKRRAGSIFSFMLPIKKTKKKFVERRKK